MDKIFECSLCGKQCIKKKDMKQHMVVHQDERPYSCEICNFSFKRKWQLTKHNEKVHKKRVLKKVVCKVCGWVGESNKLLIDHKKNCVTNLFQCDICKKQFDVKYWLEYHMMTVHSSERPFPCDICGACFKHKRNVVAHIQSVHKGQKPVKKVSNPDKIPLCQCEICGKSFYSRFGYSSHIKKIHGDGKPMCPICGKKVSCKKGLTIHLNTHTGEKPYCCEICGRSFTTKDYLKIHARIHTGESPYKCHVCPKSFKQKGSLNGHYRTNHPGLPPVSELKT
uniref:PR domain zinc finger protein 5 n=1 Tax=Cacopsylla melanoneura TaxID=428564 RepID=A0A8D8U5P1_9HEMI